MGWGQRSLSEIKICTVNVEVHDEMLREPAVQVIAEQLKGMLHQIEGDSLDAGAMEPQSITM